MMKRSSFFLVLVLEGLVGHQRIVQLQLFQLLLAEAKVHAPTICPCSWGIDLDYCDIEWFALETEIILSFLRLHPSTAFRTLLLTMRATPFLQRDSC